MKYIYWTLLLFFYLTIQLFTYLITPVLPLFRVWRYGELNNNHDRGYGYRLPKWLAWFDTRDNPLSGDSKFLANHSPTTYLSQVIWLYRNSLYGFKWSVLSLAEGSKIAWEYKSESGLIWTKLGWMIDNPEQGRYMFVFSIRLRKDRK